MNMVYTVQNVLSPTYFSSRPATATAFISGHIVIRGKGKGVEWINPHTAAPPHCGKGRSGGMTVKKNF